MYTGKITAKPDLKYKPISFTEIKLPSGYKITLTLTLTRHQPYKWMPMVIRTQSGGQCRSTPVPVPEEDSALPSTARPSTRTEKTLLKKLLFFKPGKSSFQHPPDFPFGGLTSSRS